MSTTLLFNSKSFDTCFNFRTMISFNAFTLMYENCLLHISYFLYWNIWKNYIICTDVQLNLLTLPEHMKLFQEFWLDMCCSFNSSLCCVFYIIDTLLSFLVSLFTIRCQLVIDLRVSMSNENICSDLCIYYISILTKEFNGSNISGDNSNIPGDNKTIAARRHISLSVKFRSLNERADLKILEIRCPISPPWIEKFFMDVSRLYISQNMSDLRTEYQYV